jgi:hypothetical protein
MKADERRGGRRRDVVGLAIRQGRMSIMSADGAENADGEAHRYPLSASMEYWNTTCVGRHAVYASPVLRSALLA